MKITNHLSRYFILILSLLVITISFSACKSSSGGFKIKKKSVFKNKDPKKMSKKANSNHSTLNDEQADFKAMIQKLTGHSYSDKQTKDIFKIYKKHELTKGEKAAMSTAKVGGLMSQKMLENYKSGKRKRAKLMKKMDRYTHKMARKSLKRAKKNQIHKGKLSKNRKIMKAKSK